MKSEETKYGFANVTSYPFLYAVNRGNLAMVVFAFVAVIYLIELTGRTKPAVVIAALVATFKEMPGIFAVAKQKRA